MGKSNASAEAQEIGRLPLVIGWWPLVVKILLAVLAVA
jgi:hypothetical protein